MAYWTSLLKDRNATILAAFCESLGHLLASGIISRVKDFSKSSFYWENPFNNVFGSPELDQLGLVDLTKSGFHQMCYVSFEIAIPRHSPFQPPSSAPSDWGRPCAFIQANPPWEVHLHSTTNKELRTQDNFRFKVFVGLRFPILSPEALPPAYSCEHDFRLFDNVAWQWRLVWECARCGLVCYCTCFQKAIEFLPLSKDSLSVATDDKKVRRRDLPFIEKACEACRGLPSSHNYCHEMYARSIFEVRYGAYVVKRSLDLQASGLPDQPSETLGVLANNLVRKELGFPAIGEKWVTETELYRIVKAIFLPEQVVHHYRAKWLGRQELDIYVPGKRLAIEYHGKQHYEPVKAWGGDEGLVRTRGRDARKADTCSANGVTLIVFDSDEDVTLESVRAKLTAFLPPSPPHNLKRSQD